MLEVSVIRNENFKKIALKANDLLAGWSQEYILKVLNF